MLQWPACVRTQKRLKRAFDLTFTLCASILLLPAALAAAALVRMSSAGPVLYTSERVGQDGKRFTLYKFRTMVSDADRTGPAITHRNDRRVTRIGHFLRKTKFDEFPQVLNVLRGEMSIIGPRPEVPKYVAVYTREQRRVLRVRPGLTSLAQVMYRREEELLPPEGTETHYIQEILPRKLSLDLYYVGHWSLWLDAQIFVLGVLSLLSIEPPAFLWPFEGENPTESESVANRHPSQDRRVVQKEDGLR
jgi:lipopolysaccharide/colanic/teichoic acid biosynthesis glycosyltransferase